MPLSLSLLRLFLLSCFATFTFATDIVLAVVFSFGVSHALSGSQILWNATFTFAADIVLVVVFSFRVSVR